ncbi:hypothetical protein ACLK11_10600 [Escherichia coli]
MPISIIYLNGGRQEMQFVPELCRWQVATLRLRESCLSPVFWYRLLNVIVMFTLLLSIHFKCQQGLRTRILLLRMVT